ncbi:MAG: TA system VapC family ribonuclease toxin [Bryobacteraceae bacterium]
MNSTTEADWLLDVNALIALISPGHVHHESMHRWFAKNSPAGWATCPITENGTIRIMSQPRFAAGRDDPADVIEVLRGLREAHTRDHHFWPDEISLTDESIFRVEYILSPKQVADVYLLGLAAKRGAKLVSFDRSLPWQAIRNGSAQLIETPLLQ